MKIPVNLRLVCDAAGVSAPSNLHRQFEEARLEQTSSGSVLQKMETDAQSLLWQLAEYCERDLVGYETFFETHGDAVCKRIPELQEFNELMEDAFADCYHRKGDGSAQMEKAYQLLQGLCPEEESIQRAVFGGKYYAICSDYFYQATHGAEDHRQQFADGLERFLEREPAFLSPFFCWNIMRSLFYWKVKRDEVEEWKALEQVEQMENIPFTLKNTNEYAEVFNRMGEYCYHRLQAGPQYLDKAIGYYRRANDYRLRAARPNQIGMVNTLKYLAVCQYLKQSLDDALSTAHDALTKDLACYTPGEVCNTSELIFDYDCLIVYFCEKAKRCCERKTAEDALREAETYMREMHDVLCGTSQLESHENRLKEIIDQTRKECFASV